MPLLSLRHASRFASIVGVLACAAAIYADTTAIVTTVAGGGFVNNQPAVKTYLDNPQAVVADSSGNVYIADASRILKIDHTTAILSVVAGGGPTVFDNSDGPALSVHISPSALAIDANGNILFLDSSMLRRLNLQQATIQTLAGQAGKNGETGNGGSAAQALLNSPQQICVDANGNMYIVEQAGYVRLIDAKTLTINTIAGNGGTKFGGDNGLATVATLVRPTGIAVDSALNVYIADSGDLRIRKITASTGIITTIAGNGNAIEAGDGGSASKATFLSLGELAIDSQGNLSLIDGNRVRRITAAGTISTVAGNGTPGLSGDGAAATKATLDLPAGLALDHSGNLYIADTANRRIRLVTASSGIISTIAGTSQNGDGGLAGGAVLANPQSIALDKSGNLFIAGGNVIREVNAATGVITTIAGGGTSTADGIPALQAKLTNPLSVTFDSAGNLMVGEPGLIRRIDTGGIITTIAGTGVAGFSGDGGLAVTAHVGYVTAMAFDASGRLVFADASNQRLRRIDSTTHIVTTIAGNGNEFAGPGVATGGIGNVTAVGIDSKGNIYTGGVNAYFLLKISTGGSLSTAGGIGGCGYIGDGGPATLAGICQPSSVAVDPSDNIFVGDNTCYCVRRIAAGTGIIQTVLGTGSPNYNGDGGPAASAQLRSVTSIAIFGNTLYVADGTSGVVRAVTPDTPPPSAPPAYSSLVSSASFSTGPVAPGELVTFYGNYLGPAAPGYLTLGSDGKVTTQIPSANVRVFFDDTPAPLIYVSAGQLNVVAPYAVANGLSTIRIETPGGAVTTTAPGSASGAPGIFPVAIINQDGTKNGPSNPAPVGQFVVMYGTGLGQTTPPSVDGGVTPLAAPYPVQNNAISLVVSRNPLFGSPVTMPVLYAGPSPTFVDGVCQINATVPEGAQSGENFIEISAGSNVSPPIAFYIK